MRSLLDPRNEELTEAAKERKRMQFASIMASARHSIVQEVQAGMGWHQTLSIVQPYMSTRTQLQPPEVPGTEDFDALDANSDGVIDRTEFEQQQQQQQQQQRARRSQAERGAADYVASPAQSYAALFIQRAVRKLAGPDRPHHRPEQGWLDPTPLTEWLRRQPNHRAQGWLAENTVRRPLRPFWRPL
jgi:hypothetical protein